MDNIVGTDKVFLFAAYNHKTGLLQTMSGKWASFDAYQKGMIELNDKNSEIVCLSLFWLFGGKACGEMN